jgi:glycosyltransferase involved in cell wall biosynthesis
MVGRLTPWKGHHVFLRAFAEAFAGGTQRAILAGAPLFGEERYLETLIDLADSLGIAGRVEFRGFVYDIPQLLKEADVLVHASVIPEPFGQVVVEGMAAGLAVVASDEGGPAEIVTDDCDGLLVPPQDVGALADALRRVSEDGELRERLGENARVTAKKYGSDVIAARMLVIYERLAERRCRPLTPPNGTPLA